jgi:tetratricopeptide (TPR) repeat protein
MRSVVIALLLCVAAQHARAEVESETVQKGVAAYEALDFAKAAELLNQALNESLTREEKIVAWRTLAFAYVALDKTVDARNAFTRLLKIDPNADLDKSVAPKVRALFEEARAQVATGRAPAVEGVKLPTLDTTVSPAHPAEGRAVTMKATVAGGIGRSATVFYRTRGEQNYSEVRTDGRDGHFEITVPGSAVHAPGLEYYVVALDERATAVARSGGIAEPLLVDVAAPKKPAYKRAWVWGVVAGAVVAAGAVATALALTLMPPDPKSPADVMLVSPK